MFKSHFNTNDAILEFPKTNAVKINRGGISVEIYGIVS